MAPFNENGDLVYRMPEDGSDNPIYPFNRIRLGGDGDENYPEYRHLRHHTEGTLKYPELAGHILAKAMWEIKSLSAEQIRQQLTDEEKAAGAPFQANYLETMMHDQLRKRAEWQLVSSTPEEMTITIITYFIHPPEVLLNPGQEPDVHFRITADAVIKSVNPAESQNGRIYRLKDTHDRAPEFSHLVGEPAVEKQ